MSRLLSYAAVAILSTAATVVHADLVLNEQFLTGTDPSAGQYNVDPLVRLNAQAPTVPGFGAGGWTGGAGTNQTHVVEGSLDAPGAGYETGGKVQFDGSILNNQYRSNARGLVTPYASASANGPIFLSGMISTDAFPATPENAGLRGYSLFGFTNAVGALNGNGTPSTGTLAGYYLGFRATATDTLDLVIRHRQGTTASPNGVQEDIVVYQNASPSTTYQFLLRTDVNAVSGNQETVRYWINPTDVTSEETATSTALATGTFNDFSLQNATGDIARVTVATYNWDATSYFDEFRLGTTFSEVAGAPVAPVLPGDYNGDGFVGQDDLNLVLANWGQNVTPGTANGDGSGDGFVGQDDLNQILGSWGQGSAAAAALVAVPEPASLGVVALGSLALAVRRRRA